MRSKRRKTDKMGEENWNCHQFYLMCFFLTRITIAFLSFSPRERERGREGEIDRKRDAKAKRLVAT